MTPETVTAFALVGSATLNVVLAWGWSATRRTYLETGALIAYMGIAGRPVRRLSRPRVWRAPWLPRAANPWLPATILPHQFHEPPFGAALSLEQLDPETIAQTLRIEILRDLLTGRLLPLGE